VKEICICEATVVVLASMNVVCAASLVHCSDADAGVFVATVARFLNERSVGASSGELSRSL